MKKILLLAFLISGFVSYCFGQCGGPILTVLNPSFEGTPQPHITPPSWDICMPGCTPDTQPGSWGVTLPPSNGSTYLGLVNEPSANWVEGAGQNLSSPMIAGTTYHFTIDLAVPLNPQSGVGILVPPYCVELQLWGGMSGVNSGCDQSELLWSSGAVTSYTWTTYTLTFTPTSNWNHILFNIHSIGNPPCTDGQYILVDNMTPIIPQSDVAQFNWTNVCFGNVMNFTDSSYSISGIINSWSWTFGDGGTSTVKNPTHNYLNPGSYTVTLTTHSTVPCTTSVTHTVNVWAIPTVTVSGGGAICSGGGTVPVTFTFTGTAPWNLTYSNGITPTTVNGIATSPYTINVSTTGTYTATVFSDAHCPGTSSGSAVVTVNSPPNVSCTALPVVCINLAPFPLSGCTPAGGNWAGTGVNNNIFNPSVAGVGTQTLTYTYTDPATGCTNTAQQSITVGNGLAITITPAVDSICLGAHTTLVASAADSISWSPSSTLSNSSTSTVIATPTTTTTYTVFESNTAGCLGNAYATVYVFPNSQINFTAAPIEGCEPLTVHFFYTPGPGILDSSWVWTFGDMLSDTAFSTIKDPSHMYSTAGVYHAVLNVSTIEGCHGTDTVTINVYPIPIANFIFHPDIANTDNPTINFVDQSTYANFWNWYFDDAGSLNNNWSILQNPIHIFSDSGTYHVMLIAESAHGCYDTITKPLTIYPEVLIFIPNAFTPDGNGVNDIFRPFISGIYPETFRLDIFDRWGREVYKTTDITHGWDGRGSDGKVNPEGVFSWIIHYSDLRGKQYKMLGHVTLLR